MSLASVKTCVQCKTEKSTDMFSKSASESDGVSRYCKECKSILAKEYYKNNCEKVKRKSKNRYLINRAEIIKKNKDSKEKNREKYLEQKKASYLKHRDKRIISMRAYYSLNRDKLSYTYNGWKKRNKHKANIITQNYRNKKKNRGRLSKDIIERLYILQKGKCACCGKPLGDDFHLDNISPLHLGGENIDSNVQLLMKVCNLRKGHKHPIEYMQSIGMLL